MSTDLQIAAAPTNVEHLNHKIYAYTTKAHRLLNYLKIGETHQASASIRVKQQDTTSNPDPLEIEKVWDVPLWLTDDLIHKQLTNMGCSKTRLDANREWFICTVEQVDTAINHLLHGISRPDSFKLRKEQQDCVDKLANLFMNSVSKQALLAAVMRYGKTIVSLQLAKAIGAQRVLIITYKPAVDASWREPVERHVDFNEWHYHSASEHSSIYPIELGTEGVQVLFTSFQDFNDFDKLKWQYAKDYHYDLVIVDEMHYGSDTVKAKFSLSQLSYDRVLYISGTPIKALLSGQFIEDEIYLWRHTDQMARRRQEQLAGWQTEVYRWSPVMHFHTFDIHPEARKAVEAYSNDEGFTMAKMFSSDDGITLRDQSSVELFLDQFFGRGAVHKNHCPLRVKPVDHMLWMLPPSVKSVEALSRLLASYQDQYHIINVAGDNEKDLDKVKQLIRYHSKTITLSCGRFNTGVTVPEWDMVAMLDDGRSATTYFQSIFRCASPDRARRKESCYVIDFNPQRCLEVIYEFAETEAGKHESTQQHLREWLDFAPIMDHSGNKPKQVDVDTVLDMMAETGGYVERFGSVYNINWENLEDYSLMFAGVKADKNAKILQQVTDNDLDLGKNFATSTLPATTKNKIKDDTQELKQKVVTTMRRIPTFLFGEKLQAEFPDVAAIIQQGHGGRFLEAVGVTIYDFEKMCTDGLVKTPRLNRCIMSFNQIGSR